MFKRTAYGYPTSALAERHGVDTGVWIVLVGEPHEDEEEVSAHLTPEEAWDAAAEHPYPFSHWTHKRDGSFSPDQLNEARTLA